MNRIYTLIFSLFTTTLLAQNAVGFTDLTLTDPARNNRPIVVRVHYPATQTGANAPVASGTFPLFVIGHGFLTQVTPYQNFADSLVPLGYILALPATETGLTPSHQDFGADLLFTANEMRRRATQESGFQFFGAISSRAGISGHSMGGGATFLAGSLAQSGAIDCLVGYAPAETNPSSIAAASQVTIPSLIFAGEADGVTPPATHQIPIYQAVNACKILATIPGGGHCFFMNADFPCDFGEATSSPNLSIDRAEQQRQMFRLLRPWLAYWLKQDNAAWQQLQQAISTGTTQIEQDCASLQLSSNSGEVHAPFYKAGHLSGLKEGSSYDLKIFDLSGRLLHSDSVYAHLYKVPYKLPELGTGIFLIQYRNGEFVSNQRIVMPE
jgi:dienelactone hydrolase